MAQNPQQEARAIACCDARTNGRSPDSRVAEVDLEKDCGLLLTSHRPQRLRAFWSVYTFSRLYKRPCAKAVN